MKILFEESAQVSAELLLVFGGMICVVIIFLIAYYDYLQGLGGNLSNNSTINNVTGELQNLNNSLTQT